MTVELAMGNESHRASHWIFPSSGPSGRILLVLAISFALLLGVTSARENSSQLEDPRFPLPGGTHAITTINELRAPNAARSAVERAREAVLKNKFPEAHRQIHRALTAFPNYAAALMLEGIVDAEEQNFPLAEQNLNAAIKADPFYGPAYLALAARYNDTKHYDEALLLLNRAMQLMPTSWMVYLELANTETGMEKYEAALRHIEQAEVLQPRNSHSDARAMTHFLKGCVFMRIGNQIRARPELERVIKEEPNSEFARQSRQVLAQPQLPED